VLTAKIKSAMPAMGLSNQEVTDVMNYIMNSWSNNKKRVLAWRSNTGEKSSWKLSKTSFSLSQTYFRSVLQWLFCRLKRKTTNNGFYEFLSSITICDNPLFLCPRSIIYIGK
jgi:hypothetical protein